MGKQGLLVETVCVCVCICVTEVGKKIMQLENSVYTRECVGRSCYQQRGR